MRKTIGAAIVLVLGGMVLGGTVLRDQVAQAAAAVMQVNVVNPPTSPVPVRQQGTADVNVTNTADVHVANSSLTVAPPAAVTGGGQRLQVDASQTVNLGGALTASAVVVQFRNGATEIIFRRNGGMVARFPGPGPLVLPLSQPISFDAVQCSGPDGSSCDFGWAGSAS